MRKILIKMYGIISVRQYLENQNNLYALKVVSQIKQGKYNGLVIKKGQKIRMTNYLTFSVAPKDGGSER